MLYGEQTSTEMSRVIPQCCERIVDTWLRDPQITVGHDAYYMTGTSRPDGPRRGDNTVTSDGLRIWRSEDLLAWQALGLVWALDDGPEWLRNYRVHGLNGEGTMSPEQFRRTRVPPGHPVRRALWAPKIHYSPARRNYYVVGCMNFNMGVPPAKWSGDTFGGCLLLESTTGEAYGPYRCTTDLPLTHYIDPCLFEDDDGSMHMVWQDGNLATLNDRLDGLVRVDRPWQAHFDVEPVKEGACLFKSKGRYHLGFSISAHLVGGRYTLRHAGHGTRDVPCAYQFVVASSNSLHGPYGPRYTAIVNGGHGCPYRDRDGEWWATVFHPPGPPEEQHSNPADVNKAMGPRLVAMRWSDGLIMPDVERTQRYYRRWAECPG